MVVTDYELTRMENTAATNYNAIVTHMAVGSGTTPPTSSDTTLDSEDFRDALDFDNILSNVVNQDLRLSVTENNGNDIEEIGTFDDPTSGNMYSRNETISFSKTSDKEAYYRIKTTITAVNV